MKNDFSVAQLFSESLIYFYLLCAIVLMTLFLSSYCAITSSEIGLVYQHNQLKKTLNTGIYFLLPKPLESVIKVPTHAQSLSIEKPLELICADHQIVRLNACMLSYRFDPLKIDQLSTFFQTQSVPELQPLLQGLLLEQVAIRALDQVMINNHPFNQSVKQLLQEKCNDLNYPITIENILCIITIPESLTEAFELKNRAQAEAGRIITRSETGVQKANVQLQNNVVRIEQQAHIQSEKIIQNAKVLSENFLHELILYEKEPQVYLARAKNQLLNKMRHQAINCTVILDDQQTDLRLLIPRQPEVKK